jgi:hypothetical protein
VKRTPITELVSVVRFCARVQTSDWDPEVQRAEGEWFTADGRAGDCGNILAE